MKRSFGRWFAASMAGVVLASFAMTPYADAAGRGGGGGGRAGGGARASAPSGGARQGAQANNSRADVRTNEVRNTSVNNVNVQRDVNVNVDCTGRCGGWDHPVAAAAVVGTAVAVTAAAIGSVVTSVPPSCVPVDYGGVVYQQCGATWYAPQGTQFVVVNPPY